MSPGTSARRLCRGTAWLLGVALWLVAGGTWADTEAVSIAALLAKWQAPDGVSARVDRSGDPIAVVLVSGPQTLRVLVAPLPDGAPAPGSTVLPSLMWMTDPRQPAAHWQAPLASLASYLRDQDHGQFRPQRADQDNAQGPPAFLVAETWLLLALGLVALAIGLWRAHTELLALVGPAQVAIGLLLALVPRAALPHRLVMVHFGYLHTDQATTLAELPRYGPATTLLDHALFWLAPAHHSSVQWLHVALGTLTLWPVAALAGRLAGPHAARAGWLLLALAPFSWLDHGSESMLVPAMLFWSVGTLLLDDYLRPLRPLSGRATDVAAAVVLLALCGLCRPDCLAVGVPCALLVGWAMPGARLRPQKTVFIALALAVLWLPDVSYLRDKTVQDLARGNLPRLGDAGLADLPRRVLGGWLILDPRWFPLPVTVLGFSALALPGLARRAALLWAASLLWALPMFLDFNDTSKLRLHVPSAVVAILLAAVALAVVWPRLTSAWQRGGVGLAVAALTAATAPSVLAAQLSDASELAIARAAQLARDGRPTALVVRTYDDEPNQGVHMYWPAYALEPGDRWLSVRDWQQGRLHVGERAIGLLDVRCWAHLPVQRPQLGPAGLHPACQALLDAGQGELWGADQPNIGERGFSWYVGAAELPTLRQRALVLPSRAASKLP